MKRKLVALILLVVFILSFTGCSSGQKVEKTETPKINFPEKEIRVVVPYPTGGGSDVLARKIASIIQEKKILPVPMVVVNITGSNTREALENVLKAKPDGYTILMHHSAFNTMKALSNIPMSFSDYTVLGQALEVNQILTATANGPFKTFDEYLKDAKANPSKYTIAIPGIGGANHFALEYLLAETDSAGFFNLTPFNGVEALRAQLAGDAPIRPSSSTEAANYVKSGELLSLVVMKQERLPEFPDAVSLKELGIKGEMVLRNGYFAPPGLPKEINSILADAIKQAVESDEFQKYAKEQASVGKFIPGAEWTKILEADQVKCDEIAKKIKQ